MIILRSVSYHLCEKILNKKKEAEERTQTVSKKMPTYIFLLWPDDLFGCS